MIYYRELILDRASESRKDRSWLERQWTRQYCRVFVLRNDKSLMRWRNREADKPEVIHVERSAVDDFVTDANQLVFLGLDDSGPLFALDLTNHRETALESLLRDNEFIDLRDVGWLLGQQQAAQLAYARGLMFWNRHHRYCGICGSPTLSENGGHMRRCSAPGCARSLRGMRDPGR